MRSTLASRCRGEEGAVIVEFALVAPFLVLIALGVFEFGTAYRNETTVAGAVRNAARADAQAQNLSGGDRNALQSLAASLGSTQNFTVTKVIVYKSTTSGGAPSATCLAISPSNSGAGSLNNCNVYNLYQLNNATSGTWMATGAACTTSGSSWDRYWCPSGRNTRLAGANSPPDYLGVYVQGTYDTLTGLVGDLTVSDYAVNRVEPTV